MQPSISGIAMEPKVQRDFKAYLKSISDRLPELSARTFALRGKSYAGCGFHWSLERSLGKLLVAANDFENPDYWRDGRNGFSARLMIEVGMDSFIESLEAAERSAAATDEDRARAADRFVSDFKIAYGG